MKKLKLVSLLLSLTIATVSCSQMKKNEKNKPINTIKEVNINSIDLKNITENYKKSTKIFTNELTSAYFIRNNKKNSLISPLSIKFAFSTLAEGADGNTKEELSKFLKTEFDDDFKKNTQIHKILLNNTSPDNSKLIVKDSIWLDESFKNINKDFLDRATEFHQAEIYKANLNTDETANYMSEWVKKNTNNLIDPKIEKQDILLSIINTMYFKSNWIKEFNKNMDTSESFKTENGKSQNQNFMNQTFNNSAYFETKDFIIAALDMNFGTIRILLPKDNVNLSDLLKDESTAKNTLSHLFDTKLNNNAKIEWKVPKLNLNSKIDLKQLISEMGYGEMFSKNANLSKIEKNLIVSDASHLTGLVLKHEGIEAAAMTKIDVKSESMIDQSSKEIKMHLTKPFMFSLQISDFDDLFVGTVFELNKN